MLENKNKIRKRCLEIFEIILGTFILCISVEVFILPYHILSGGVAGIAVAVEPFFHINETLLANLLTVVLFMVGFFGLGKKFAMNTLISSLLYPVFTTLLAQFDFHITVPTVLASFYAGFLGGVGIGIVMRAGASTGGMDIPPIILNKLTGIPISKLVMVTDACTIILGIISYDINATLIGLVSVFASEYGIRMVLEAGQGSAAKSVQIISDKYLDIVSDISKELDRGVTLLSGQGGYTREEKKVILCVVSGRQYTKLLEIVRENDPTAFVITTDASDMHGEGFTYSSPNI